MASPILLVRAGNLKRCENNSVCERKQTMKCQIAVGDWASKTAEMSRMSLGDELIGDRAEINIGHSFICQVKYSLENYE